LDTKWDRSAIQQYAESTHSWKVVSKQYDILYKRLLKE